MRRGAERLHQQIGPVQHCELPTLLFCRELRVGYLISGKCHATGDEPSLYVELTDTRDWHVRWAEFYRFGAGSMLAEDGQAVAALVRQLRAALAERNWH